MNRERHQQAMSIFLRAVDLEKSERTKLLDETCTDPALREEVESLLKHHTNRTLIATEKFANPRRTTRLAQWPIFREVRFALERRRHLVAASAAIVVILLVTACWVYLRIQHSLNRSVEDQLTTVLQADVRALEMWINVQQADVEAWAENESVREFIVHRTQNPNAMDQQQANAKITQLLETVCERAGHYGVAAIDIHGKIIATSKDSWSGRRVNDGGMRYLHRLNHGQSIFTIPTREARFSAGVLSMIADPTIAVAAPVWHEDRVIGSLCFGFDADEEFTELLAIAQIGKGGETYAFDANGLLLSNLRHHEQLASVGLLDENLPSALNVELRDPGGNLLRGFEPTEPRKSQNPTQVIRRAVPSALDPTPDTSIESDIRGYRNYLGVNVVGAWQWLGEDLAFGVVTELPYDEAFAPLRYVRRAFFFLIVSVITLTLGLVVSSLLLVRLSRQVGEVKQLGAYELLELIGQGGMGRVYRARHAFLKRDAAIKLLDGVLDKETIERFEQEAQLTCQLTNPNTIQVYDYGRTDAGIFYYAMELLEGCTLEQLVAASGVVSSNRVIFILRQVCASLQEAHEHGLIHRDIKPANIMLCRRGGISDFVKVLDFGIAKKTTCETNLTRHDAIVGTPHYIAPERIAGAQTVDGRSDLFSVGCVGFYLLVGEPPIPVDNPGQLFQRLLSEPARAPSSRTALPIVPELDELIEHCLQRDPAKRPQDAREIVYLLDRLAEQHPWHPDDADAWWEEFADANAATGPPASAETKPFDESRSVTRGA